MSKYIKNIINNLITKGLSTTITFIMTLILGRVLGVDNYGLYSFYMIVANLFIQYGHMGILNSTTHFQKVSRYSEDKVYSNNLNFVTFLWLAISIVVVTITYLTYKDYFIISIILSFYVLFQIVSNLILRLMIGQERNYIYNNVETVFKLINLAGIILLVYLKKINLVNLISLITFIQLFKVLVLIKVTNLKYERFFSLNLVKQEFQYGIIILGGSFFAFLNYRMDQFMIKYFLENKDLGLYSMSVNISELIFLVPLSISLAFMGKIYNVEKKHIKDLTRKSTVIAFYISILLTSMTIMAIPIIIFILGNNYSEIKDVLIIILIGNVFSCFGQILSNYFFFNNLNMTHFKISFNSFIINFILNLVLIPSYGIRGAATASLVSYILYGGLYLRAFLSKERITIKEFFCLSLVDK